MFKRCSCLFTIILLGVPMLANAEPIAFEQAANVTGMTGIEIGCEIDYSYEKIEQEGASAIENTITDIPIFVRLGFPVLEIKLTMPYGNVSDNVSAAMGEDFSGIRNVGVGLKTGLLALPIFNLAVGLNTKFPTAEPEKYFFGEGLALNPFMAADLDIMIVKLHAHVGYEYRGGYNTSFNPLTSVNLTDAVELKPGDATKWALGIEIPTGDFFFLHAELIGTSYGEVKLDGNPIEDSAGSTMSFVPGIRLQKGPFKAKFGYAIPLEKAEDRPQAAPRSDWRIIGGVSLLFGF